MALHLAAIIVCGFLGAIAGWGAMRLLEWQGTAAALLAATIGMVVATLSWTAGVAVREALRAKRAAVSARKAHRG